MASAGWTLTEHATLCLRCPHLSLLTKNSLRPLKNRSQLEDAGILLPYGVAKRVGNSWSCTQSLAEGQPGRGVPVPECLMLSFWVVLTGQAHVHHSLPPQMAACSFSLLFLPCLPASIHQGHPSSPGGTGPRAGHLVQEHDQCHQQRAWRSWGNCWDSCDASLSW